MPEQKKTESQFVDYETAKMLKELGFKEICYGFFAYLEKHDIWIVMDLIKSENKGGVVSAPLWQQVEQWLWEKNEISIKVAEHDYLEKKFFFNPYKDHRVVFSGQDGFDSPITAKIEGIKQAIIHLHSKQ